MPALVTIYIAMYPQDIMVIRARLESENIECYVQDELTLQTNPFYSNAIGGVTMQVKQEDAEHAKSVLREGGYIPEGEDTKIVDSVFNRLFEKFYVDGKIQLPLKKIAFLTGAIVITSFIIYLIFRPSIEEKIIEKEWCLDYISFYGKNYEPYTNGIITVIHGDCDEFVNFNGEGYVSFPGFNTQRIEGDWKLNGDTLQIISTDSLQNVFQGNYTIEIDENSLILTSPKTTIYCN